MWDLLPSEDEAMIAEAVRAFLLAELPIDRLRPNAKPIDFVPVRQAIAELGWFGIGLPEEVGGSGLGLVEEMLIQRECGRQLAPPDLLSTVLAAHVAHAAGDLSLAGELVAATTVAALGVGAGVQAGAQTPLLAFDWSPEAVLLVWNAQGVGLFDAASFTGARGDNCLDNSLSMHAGELDFGASRHWIGADQAPLALRAHVLLSAALCGLAERAAELTVAYAGMREQFGKPIGTFQAVKHRCADMAVGVRLAWYQTCMAALKVQSGSPDAAVHAASAKLVSARAAHENGRAAIQLHGGIGFQSECDAHWFMKRAHVYDRVGGAARDLARSIACAESGCA